MKQMTPFPLASHASIQGTTIRLCTGTGEGPMPLAAIDAALVAAGVADHNLIRLSSVIPPSDHGQLERDPLDTLDAVRRSRAAQHGSIKTVIESRTRAGKPVCALVAAVYGSEPW
jgi:pyruvoyl-dependent arginine decarboxylase (PvlArgDC)